MMSKLHVSGLPGGGGGGIRWEKLAEMPFSLDWAAGRHEVTRVLPSGVWDLVVIRCTNTATITNPDSKSTLSGRMDVKIESRSIYMNAVPGGLMVSANRGETKTATDSTQVTLVKGIMSKYSYSNYDVGISASGGTIRAFIEDVNPGAVYTATGTVTVYGGTYDL